MSVTVDVEEDYGGWNLVSYSGVKDGIPKLLGLFKKLGIKATFFVNGNVFRKFPQIIMRLLEENHEIALHGPHFSLKGGPILYRKFYAKKRLAKDVQDFANLVGHTPEGFRSAFFIIDIETLKTLGNLKFKYDSSVIPSIRPGRYNLIKAPRCPYHPSSDDPSRVGNLRLLEIPVSVISGCRIPISLSYMQFLGYRAFNLLLRLFKTPYPLVFYLHSYEVSEVAGVLNVPWHVRRIYFRKSGEEALRFLTLFLATLRREKVRFVPLKYIYKMFNGGSSQ